MIPVLTWNPLHREPNPKLGSYTLIFILIKLKSPIIKYESRTHTIKTNV